VNVRFTPSMVMLSGRAGLAEHRINSRAASRGRVNLILLPGIVICLRLVRPDKWSQFLTVMSRRGASVRESFEDERGKHRQTDCRGNIGAASVAVRNKKPRILPGPYLPSRSMTNRKKPLKLSDVRRCRTAAVQRAGNTPSEFVFEQPVCLDKIMIWQHAGLASHKEAFYWGSI
jgi:hypothetical protein